VLNQGCPTGGPRVGCDPQPIFMWPSKARQIKLFFTVRERIRMKNHILNVLFIHMIQNMQPAVTIWTLLCNDS